LSGTFSDELRRRDTRINNQFKNFGRINERRSKNKCDGDHRIGMEVILKIREDGWNWRVIPRDNDKKITVHLLSNAVNNLEHLFKTNGNRTGKVEASKNANC
jgi:mRNA-degrading endonuclease RelE of RelBE toxin-antitoxin system